jgi:hypothetical protein
VRSKPALAPENPKYAAAAAAEIRTAKVKTNRNILPVKTEFFM